jgi:hypothetical protein
MRTKLMNDAKCLQMEKEAEFEKVLHQEKQKRLHAEVALRDAKASGFTDASSSQQSQIGKTAVLNTLKAEHASESDKLREASKASLEHQARRLTNEAKKREEKVRKEHTSNTNFENDNLRNEVSAANSASASVRKLEELEREGRHILQKHSEKAQKDLNRQQSELKKDARVETARSSELHDKGLKACRLRASKAEAELANLKAACKDSAEKSQVTLFDLESDRVSQAPSSQSSERPRSTILTLRDSDGQSSSFQRSAFPSDIDLVENIPPRAHRDIGEINTMLTSELNNVVHKDSPSLSELPSMILPYDSRVSQDRLPWSEHFGSISEQIESNSLENPFWINKEPSSTGGARPNTASRLAALPAHSVVNITPTVTNMQGHQSIASYQPFRTSPTGAVAREAKLEISDSQSQERHVVPHSFQTPQPRDEPRDVLSSSPDFVVETQASQRRTTYSHGSRKLFQRDLNRAAEANQSSTSNKRRSPPSMQHEQASKRGKLASPCVHYGSDIPETQFEHSKPVSQDMPSLLQNDRIQTPQVKKSESQSQTHLKVPKPQSLTRILASEAQSQTLWPIDVDESRKVIRSRSPLRSTSTALSRSRPSNLVSATTPGSSSVSKTRRTQAQKRSGARPATSTTTSKCKLISLSSQKHG